MFNQLKKYLQLVFGISSIEANGIVVLFAIFAIIILAPIFIARYNDRNYNSYLADQHLLDSVLCLLKADTLVSDKAPEKESLKITLNRFFFDPNIISAHEMDSMGMPGWLAKRIIKYRDAGGKFKVKNDLLKIYGMPAGFYREVEKYIQLPDSVSVIKEVIVTENKPGLDLEVTAIDLNEADSAEFTKIRGIGPKLAGRIIRYRSLLGGFTSVDQIEEIYGITDLGRENIIKTGTISESFSPQKININFADWKELVRHPYFDKNIANSIISNRDESGPFSSIDDLKKIKSFNDSIISKIKSYITF